jgi:hypothetical protein
MAWLGVIAAAAATGCGKAVYSGSTFDKPLFEFGGLIVPTSALSEEQRRAARPGLIWIDPAQNKPDIPSPPHSLVAAVIRADGGMSDRYSLKLHRPPPPESFFEVEASGQTATLAVAEIVLYEDGDGDGTFSVKGPRAEIAAPDRFLAASTSIILYGERPFQNAPMDFPLGPATKAGYDLVQLACAGRLPPTAPPRTKAPDNPYLITLVVQPQDTLPEVRTCMRSHSP